MSGDRKTKRSKELAEPPQWKAFGVRFPPLHHIAALNRMESFFKQNPKYHQHYSVLPSKQALEIQRAFVSDYISDKKQAVKRLKSAIDAAYQRKMDNANRKTRKSKPTTSAPGYVYLLSAIFSDGNTHYKIGKTSNPSDRMKLFKVKLPVQPELIHLIKTDDMNLLEWELHNRFGDKCSGGEWHLLTPDDVAYIKGLT